MREAMQGCEQTAGQTVLDHGESVCKHLFALIDHLKGTYSLPEGTWRIPDAIFDHKVLLLSKLHNEGKLRLYTTYHDCGKPYCRYVDKKTGAVHFKEHARMSWYIWSCIGGNDVVGGLIKNDMVIHTATAEEIDRLLQTELSPEDSASLLLVALAELHSNARMFGGVSSTNFKMKFNKVERRSKQICKHLVSRCGPVLADLSGGSKDFDSPSQIVLPDVDAGTAQ